MKKKIAVLFLASILALSAAACNSSSSGTTSKVESAGGTTSSVSSVNEMALIVRQKAKLRANLMIKLKARLMKVNQRHLLQIQKLKTFSRRTILI